MATPQAIYILFIEWPSYINVVDGERLIKLYSTFLVSLQSNAWTY